MRYYLLLLLIPLTMSCNLPAKTPPSSPGVIPVTTESPVEYHPYPIVVIGAGAAGTMAVKRAVLNNNEVLLFTGAKQERRRSRGNWVRKVDNVPGLERYSRTILELRNEVLSDLVNGPLNHNLWIVEESVVDIEKEGELFKLRDGAGHSYYAKYVLLATGMMDEQPHIQGSIRPILDFANGQTVAYCLVCDGHRSLGKKTVVIGYSDEAALGALLLSDKYRPTDLSILTNGHPPEFSAETLAKLKQKDVKVFQSPIHEILGNRDVKQLSGFKLESGEIVSTEIGFVMLGIRPNNQLALQLGAQVDGRGLVLTDLNGETNVPNLFVAGDLRAHSMKQIYTAWQHSVEILQMINKRIRSASDQ